MIGLVLLYSVRIVVQVTRQTIRDRLPRQAASLSFQTLISAIPLSVIVFSVLSRIISRQEVGSLSDWLSRHTLPSRARAIAPVLQQFASDVDVHALGLMGGLGLFVVGTVLFVNVTQVVNDIWRVRRRQPVSQRVVAAFLFLLVAPVLLGLSAFFAERFIRIPRSFDLFVPLAITVAGLWVAYSLLPWVRVRAGAAAVAAFFVGLTLEAGKTGFGFYVAQMEVSLQGLYGAIGFVPLALLWLYLSWLLFLFGVELTFTLQHLRALWLRDAHLHRAALGATTGAELALRVMHEVYRSGKVSCADLAEDLHAAPQAVDLVVDRLSVGELITVDKERTIAPTRAASEVPVVEVLGLFSQARPDRRSRSYDQFDQLLDRLEEARHREAGGLTMADLS
jgi:YihY family inner membrane protein